MPSQQAALQTVSDLFGRACNIGTSESMNVSGSRSLVLHGPHLLEFSITHFCEHVPQLHAELLNSTTELAGRTDTSLLDSRAKLDCFS